MGWITIILLLFVGIVLLVVEIIFVPGTTVLGLIGAALMVFGIISGYSTYGPQTGTIILVLTLVVAGVSTILGFKSSVWKKFALKNTNTSKVNEDRKIEHLLGAEGVALSALRPYGKAEFYDEMYEVKTMGNYVESGTKVKILQIDKDHKIFVEQIKNN